SRNTEPVPPTPSFGFAPYRRASVIPRSWRSATRRRASAVRSSCSPKRVDWVGQVAEQAGSSPSTRRSWHRGHLLAAPIRSIFWSRSAYGETVPSSRLWITPKGQALTQVPQPLQTSSCTTIEPCSDRKIAPVGHTSRQPAFVQCLHTSEDISQRNSGVSGGVRSVPERS